MITLEMLPARHGDCLLIEYGAQPYRILIDGGPWFAYEDPGGIRERLKGVGRLDLVVMTHIDTDHVDGIIRLLQDDKLDLDYGDIWFNGWKHINLAVSGVLGGKQGEYLGALLEDRKLPWNTNDAWQDTRGAVVVPSGGGLPVADLPGGATATLLSPGPEQLRLLEDDWAESLGDFLVPGGTDEALAQLKKRAEYGPPEGALGETVDRKPANGSSIAFVFEFDGTKLLLAGDAHADVLETSVAAYTQRFGRLQVAAFKLPHHGSFGNLSKDLLKSLDAERYLISTNGKLKAKHPDDNALKLIIRFGTKPPHFVFNYDVETTEHWLANKDNRPYTAERTNRIEIA